MMVASLAWHPSLQLKHTRVKRGVHGRTKASQCIGSTVTLFQLYPFWLISQQFVARRRDNVGMPVGGGGWMGFGLREETNKGE